MPIFTCGGYVDKKLRKLLERMARQEAQHDARRKMFRQLEIERHKRGHP